MTRRYCDGPVSGTYIKRYLYFLQKGYDGDKITIESAAQAMVCNESDIMRALTYWQKAGAIRITVDEMTREITHVELLPVQAKQIAAEQYRKYRRTLNQLERNGVALTQTRKCAVQDWYGKLGMSEDLVMEAVNRCIRKTGKANFAYINKIIIAWHDSGLKTIDAVRKADRAYFQGKHDLEGGEE